MLHSAVEKFCPPIDFFIDLIDSQTPFQFAKLNHCFWDAALSVKKNPNMTGADLPAHLPEGWIHFHGMEFMLDMFSVIADIPNTSLFFGASDCAAPGLAAYNYNKDQEIRDLISTSFPRRYRLFYGPIMKKYALEGTLHNFLKLLADERDVLIVGMSHTRKIQQQFAFKSFRHFELDLHKTTINRLQILGQIQTVISAMNKPVVLFQAGESLSLWFIYHLQKTQPFATTMDIGRALDVWAIPEYSPKCMPDLQSPQWKNLFKNA